MKKLLLSAFICLLLNSCYTIKPIEFRRAENFSASKNNGSPKVSFGIVFHNPNSFGCTISTIESMGELNNQLIFNASIQNSVRAKGNSDFTFPVSADVAKMDWKQLLGSGINLLLNNEAVPMKVKGKITVKKFIFSKTFNFDYTERIDKTMLQKLF